MSVRDEWRESLRQRFRQITGAAQPKVFSMDALRNERDELARKRTAAKYDYQRHTLAVDEGDPHAAPLKARAKKDLDRIDERIQEIDDSITAFNDRETARERQKLEDELREREGAAHKTATLLARQAPTFSPKLKAFAAACVDIMQTADALHNNIEALGNRQLAHIRIDLNRLVQQELTRACFDFSTYKLVAAIPGVNTALVGTVDLGKVEPMEEVIRRYCEHIISVIEGAQRSRATDSASPPQIAA